MQLDIDTITIRLYYQAAVIIIYYNDSIIAHKPAVIPYHCRLTVIVCSGIVGDLLIIGQPRRALPDEPFPEVLVGVSSEKTVPRKPNLPWLALLFTG